MSFDGHALSLSGCAIRPNGQEIGSIGYVGEIQHSSPIGPYAMATAEHREPCESRGSCTVLGAPRSEIPPGDSSCGREQVQQILAQHSKSAPTAFDARNAAHGQAVHVRSKRARSCKCLRLAAILGQKAGHPVDLGFQQEIRQEGP
jgi:hypothetical protein